MKEQEIYTRQMPFVETDEQVDAIVERCTRRAIAGARRRRAQATRRVAWVSAAAVAVLVLVAGIVLFLKEPRVDSGVDTVLAMNNMALHDDADNVEEWDNALIDVTLWDEDANDDELTGDDTDLGPIDEFIASCDDDELDSWSDDTLYI